MNRIYCAVGKIIEVTQDIEEIVGEICKNSEIITALISLFGDFVPKLATKGKCRKYIKTIDK